jgi:hypothetical protein
MRRVNSIRSAAIAAPPASRHSIDARTAHLAMRMEVQVNEDEMQSGMAANALPDALRLRRSILGKKGSVLTYGARLKVTS